MSGIKVAIILLVIATISVSSNEEPRLIGPHLEFAIPISMTENGTKIHFAEMTKRLKDGMHGDVPSNRIGFGEPAKEGELPYQVFLLLAATCGDNFYGLSCGGTLIADRNENQWIVTAAHCVNPGSSSLPRDHSKFTLRVRAGSIDNESSKHERIIPLDNEHVIFHPDWKGSNDDLSCQDICDNMVNRNCDKCNLCRSATFSDVALLKIDEAFEDKLIRPIQMDYDLLNKAQTLELKEKSVIISGWGENEDRTSPQFLMKQYVSVGATEKRVIELSHKAGHGACKGDSGGPAVYKCTKECASDTDILVGTSSFTYYNQATGCNKSTASYYTNILVFQDWIKKTMNELVDVFQAADVGKLCEGDYRAIKDKAECLTAHQAAFDDTVFIEMKGDGWDLPPGCIVDRVRSNRHYVYWNPKGKTISLDKRVRPICRKQKGSR